MEIKTDDRNARKHGDRNKETIKASLETCGAGRSIVMDSENVIIGGNGVFEQAQALGLKVKIIESDGSELVVVKRTDLKTGDDKRKLLALADNRTAELAEWDNEALEKLIAELSEVDLEGIGLDEDFMAKILKSFNVNEADAPELKDGDRQPFRQATFTLHDEQWEVIEAAIAKAKAAGGGESAVNENSNGNALAWICERYNRG
jgi:hypothetical protein